MIEAPEGFRLGAGTEELLYVQIKNRIAFLKAELEEVNRKLQHEMWFFRRRQLEDQKQQLEHELRWAKFQEQHLTKAIFETRSI